MLISSKLEIQMKKALLAGLVSMVVSGTAAAAVPVFSDDFESYAPALTLTALGSNWTTLLGNVDVIGVGSAYDPLPNGGKYVDLDGTGSAPITWLSSASFAVVAGQQYQLTFDYAGNNRGGSPDSMFLTVEVASQAAVSQSLLGVTSSTGWTTSTVTFTPTATSASIRLLHLSGDNQGILLDNVSVVAVPEASEWAMMLAGLGVVGLIARRRRQAVA